MKKWLKVLLLVVASVLFEASASRSMRYGQREVNPPVFNPREDSILIFSPSKTGTTTLQRSLGRLMLPQCQIAYKSWHAGHGRATKVHGWQEATAFLQQQRARRTWLLSSTRNELARRISAYFQTSHVNHTDQQFMAMPIKSKINEFRKSMLGADSDHWWRDNFEPLGLNLSEQPFDFKQRFLHFQKTFKGKYASTNLQVIILRLEDIADWGRMLTPFFPSVQVLADNKAEGKFYSDQYNQFLSAFRYTESEISTLMKTEGMMRFYTQQEQNKFASDARAGGGSEGETRVVGMMELGTDHWPLC